MKFACERCGRSYTVADELRGRAFKMKCKSCDHLIVVKPTTAPSAQTSRPQEPVPPPSPRTTSKISYLAKDRPSPEPSPGLAERLPAAPPRLAADSIEPRMAKPAGPPSDEPLFSIPPAPSLAPPAAPPPANLTLVDSGGPADEAAPPSEEPPVDEAVAAVLEAAMGTSLPEAALGGGEVRAGLKDPFADFEHEPQVTPEPPAPLRAQPAPPAPPPEASVSPARADSSPFASLPARARSLPKMAIYGVAAGLVVVVVLVLALATRGGKPPGPPTASDQAGTAQLAPVSPGLRVIITQPELAAPDPQLLAAQEAAKKAAAAAEEQSKQPAEGGLQGRPVATPAEKLPHGLERAGVLRVVGGSRAAIDACLAEAVKRDASLRESGRMIDLVLTVNPSGKVGSAAIDDAQLAETPLAPCLADAVRGMVFPRFQGEPQPFRVPLTFGDVK